MGNMLLFPSAYSNGQIQLKSLAEEMQAVSKGLEKVEQELTASENDGVISAGFQKVRGYTWETRLPQWESCAL